MAKFTRCKYHLPKFDSPDTNGLYKRKQLFRQLSQYKNIPALWLSAPAGFGKTSLVCSYLADARIPLIWYQVDAGDSDIASFFHHMALCIKNAYPRKRARLPDFTQEYINDLPAFSINFFRQLYAIIEPGTALVIDNYQDCSENTKLHQVMEYALTEASRINQLIIISRMDPPPELTRFRVSATLKLISLDDICLKKDECRRLAEMKTSRSLSHEQLEDLYQLTQGWAAGLVLMLEYLNEGESSLEKMHFDSQQALLNYIAQEIFIHFDQATRKVLINTSFLDRINLSDAKKLTNVTTTGEILERLSKQQLLTIRHKNKDNSFEYHPLFRSFLRERAISSLTKKQLVELQNKTASLLLQQGDIQAAGEVYISNQNHQGLISLILDNANDFIQKGLHQTIQDWVEILPSEMLDSNNWLKYWKAACHLQHSPQAAREMLLNVHNDFLRDMDAKGVYLSFCNIIESHLQLWDNFSDFEYWIDYFDTIKEKIASIPGIELKIRVNVALFSAMMFSCPQHRDFKKRTKKVETAFRLIPVKQVKVMLGSMLSCYYGISGEFKKMAKTNRILELFLGSDNVSSVVKIMIQNAMGIEQIYRGNIQQQERIWTKGLADSRQAGLVFFNRIFNLHLTNVYIVKNELRRAEIILHEIKDKSICEDDIFYSYYIFLKARIEMEKGCFKRARILLIQGIEMSEKNKFINGNTTLYCFLAICLARLGEYDKANQSNEKACAQMKYYGVNSLSDFVYYINKAYIYFVKTDFDDAEIYLRRSLITAKDAEIYSTAYWYGDMYRSLAAWALERNIEIEYIQEFIRRNQITPPQNAVMAEYWPWPIKIYTLGGFDVLIHGQRLNSKTKPYKLLKVLISFGGTEVHIDRIIDALWPEVEGDQGMARFKTTLSRLRQSLADMDILLLQNHRLSLNKNYVWLDIWSLDHIFDQLDMAENTAYCDLTEKITKILHLYKNHFLVNELSSWSISQRETLRSKFVRQLLSLANRLEAENMDTATHAYCRLLEIDPLIEEAYQGIIRCYIKHGRHAEAAVCYQRAADVFKQTLGILPSEKTRQLLDQ